MVWDIFISYATEDRDSLAAPLARALRTLGFSVWFDEHEIRPGDSIRHSIEKGLSHSKLGVVVLSPAFFQKTWTRLELGGLFARYAAQGARIVPVWHEIAASTVLEHAPMLADIKAVLSTAGVDRIAADIASIFAEMTSHMVHLEAQTAESIRVDIEGNVRGIDETLVEYSSILIQEGKEPELSLEIHRNQLGYALELKTIVFEAIEWSGDIHRILRDLQRSGAKGKSQRSLYLALRVAEQRLATLEKEIHMGMLWLLRMPEIAIWLPFGSDKVAAMEGYVARFFMPQSPPFGIILWWEKDPGWWKAMVYLPESEAVDFSRRSHGSRHGWSYLDFTHETIVRCMVPGIVYRVVCEQAYPKRMGREAIPEGIFDLEKWHWRLYEPDPGWRHLTLG